MGLSKVNHEGRVIVRKYPTSSKEHKVLAKYQKDLRSYIVPAEKYALDLLNIHSKLKWNRQSCWAYRIFDFWCSKKGIAIEIDGDSHNKTKNWDKDTDIYLLRKSGILVLRCKNFDEQSLLLAIKQAEESESWNERRKAYGLKELTQF